MKEKIANKIASMRNSDKKGMEVLGWILTIVLTVAVVGIIWFFVQPTVDSTAEEATTGISEDSTSLIDNASQNATSGSAQVTGD